jgi:CDP-glucose 4,6-dehydratase
MTGDISDLPLVARAVNEAQPDIVIHMAAQALVRQSYADPVGTFETNVMGTVNVLEAVRKCPTVRGVLVVTSDKCYQNLESNTAFKETEPLGGNDPYSSSKAGTEIVTAAYRASFFNDQTSPSVATPRAGNVFGGGDWGADRLIPDAMRSFRAGETLLIRHKNSGVPPGQDSRGCARLRAHPALESER